MNSETRSLQQSSYFSSSQLKMMARSQFVKNTNFHHKSKFSEIKDQLSYQLASTPAKKICKNEQLLDDSSMEDVKNFIGQINSASNQKHKPYDLIDMDKGKLIASIDFEFENRALYDNEKTSLDISNIIWEDDKKQQNVKFDTRKLYKTEGNLHHVSRHRPDYFENKENKHYNVNINNPNLDFNAGLKQQQDKVKLSKEGSFFSKIPSTQNNVKKGIKQVADNKAIRSNKTPENNIARKCLSNTKPRKEEPIFTNHNTKESVPKLIMSHTSPTKNQNYTVKEMIKSNLLNKRQIVNQSSRLPKDKYIKSNLYGILSPCSKRSQSRNKVIQTNSTVNLFEAILKNPINTKVELSDTKRNCTNSITSKKNQPKDTNNFVRHPLTEIINEIKSPKNVHTKEEHSQNNNFQSFNFIQKHTLKLKTIAMIPNSEQYDIKVSDLDFNKHEDLNPKAGLELALCVVTIKSKMKYALMAYYTMGYELYYKDSPLIMLTSSSKKSQLILKRDFKRMLRYTAFEDELIKINNNELLSSVIKIYSIIDKDVIKNNLRSNEDFYRISGFKTKLVYLKRVN